MNLVVDGRDVEVAAGASVLDAINRLTIPLPQLCKDPDRPALGACRTCLVHVEGQRGTPAACHLPARDGMIVSTTHPEVERIRTTVLDLTRSMLTDLGASRAAAGAGPAGSRGERHDGDERQGFGQVGVVTARYAVGAPSWPALHRFEPDASKSFFVLDRDACILCGR